MRHAIKKCTKQGTSCILQAKIPNVLVFFLVAASSLEPLAFAMFCAATSGLTLCGREQSENLLRPEEAKLPYSDVLCKRVESERFWFPPEWFAPGCRLLSK